MSLSLPGLCALRPLKKIYACVLPLGCKASMRVRLSPKCVSVEHAVFGCGLMVELYFRLGTV